MLMTYYSFAISQKLPVSPEFKSSELKHMGVLFSFLKHKTVIVNNMALLVAKVEKKWLSELSIFVKGNVLIVDSLLAHVFFHLSAGYLPCAADFRRVRQLFFGFLWGEGRREPVARSSVETSVLRGGLGLVRLTDRF